MKLAAIYLIKTKNNDWRINSLFDTPVFYSHNLKILLRPVNLYNIKQS